MRSIIEVPLGLSVESAATPPNTAAQAGGAARKSYEGRRTGKEDRCGGACASWKTASPAATDRPWEPASEARWSARPRRDASTVARGSGWRLRCRESSRPPWIALAPGVPDDGPARGTGVLSGEIGAGVQRPRTPAARTRDMVRLRTAFAEDSCRARTRFAVANAQASARAETMANRFGRSSRTIWRTAGVPPLPRQATCVPHPTSLPGLGPTPRWAPVRLGGCPNERHTARLMGSPVSSRVSATPLSDPRRRRFGDQLAMP